MKALILNSGMGSRMLNLTLDKHKSMVEISKDETILSRQLKFLKHIDIKDIIITTGYLGNKLKEYLFSLNLSLNLTFIYNDLYKVTNYIYSMYLASNFLDDDIILMHGDLVFEKSVLEKIANSQTSCMKISTTEPLPQKDFKVKLKDNKIEQISIELKENCFEAQALYKFKKNDLYIWLDNIKKFCHNGNTKCYAENALNEVLNKINLEAFDAKGALCKEIDTPQDLEKIINRLKNS